MSKKMIEQFNISLFLSKQFDTFS